jgi:prohibitin 2
VRGFDRVLIRVLAWQVYPEGTHFMIPWFDRPVIYDVRARPNIVDSTSGSRDLQMVSDAVIECDCGMRVRFENVYR